MFINELKTFKDFKQKRKSIIEDLPHCLKDSSWADSIQDDKTTPFSAQFVVIKNEFKIKLDLLPTFDVLGHHPDKAKKSALYQELIKSNEQVRQAHSAAMCELQVDFVKNQPARVKNLIRLVKYWRKEIVEPNKKYENGRYPTSYLLELITIYVWEKDGSPERFDMAVAFKAVLQQLVNYSNMNVAWDINYDSAMASLAKSKMERPILLDPANPTNNVFSASSPSALVHVSQIARDSMETPLLRDVSINF